MHSTLIVAYARPHSPLGSFAKSSAHDPSAVLRQPRALRARRAAKPSSPLNVRRTFLESLEGMFKQKKKKKKKYKYFLILNKNKKNAKLQKTTKTNNKQIVRLWKSIYQIETQTINENTQNQDQIKTRTTDIIKST